MRAGGGFPEVKAKDYWLEQVRLGRAFGANESNAGGVGTNGHLELWNPAGSGKTFIVHRLSVSLSAAGSITVGIHTSTGSDLTGPGFNLLAGGAAPVGEIREQVFAGSVGSLVWGHAVLGATPVVVEPVWLLELPAGKGLWINGEVNMTVAMSVSWVEL